MGKGLQAIRGMNDILPDEMGYWHHLEEVLRRLTSSFCYQEIRFPIVENTSLFKRSIGDHTDIVEKEMYTFDDRNGDSLTLRPEGTAGCARAGIQHGLFYNQQQRLWYLGPMYRHERPQKGRYRQFYQFGMEAVGFAGPETDVELIQLGYLLFKELGLLGEVRLEINSLGTKACRQSYTEALTAYFSAHKDALDEDSKRRLTTNPLRILDSKNPDLKSLIHEAPKFSEYLSNEASQHFKTVLELLDALDIAYVVNEKLVRGLDYYTHTVFEWVTDSLGAQGAVCSGGRYDGLVEQLGGKPTPAVGFALGIERLIAMMTASDLEVNVNRAHLYVFGLGKAEFRKACVLANELRENIPGLRLVLGQNSGSFKNQMKKADKSGARYALIIGEDELKESVVTVKPLREKGEQVQVAESELNNFISDTFK